jgi:hypothetical protein
MKIALLLLSSMTLACFFYKAFDGGSTTNNVILFGLGVQAFCLLMSFWTKGKLLKLWIFVSMTLCVYLHVAGHVCLGKTKGGCISMIPGCNYFLPGVKQYPKDLPVAW